MAETITIEVLQELGEIKKFWNELFDVIGILNLTLPSGRDGVKLTVGHIKPVRICPFRVAKKYSNIG